MLQPIKCKGSNQGLMQSELWQVGAAGHIKTKLAHQPGSDVTLMEQTAQAAKAKLHLQHICYEVIVH